MSIYCGKCQGRHASLSEVRRCGGVEAPPDVVPAVAPEPATARQLAYITSLAAGREWQTTTDNNQYEPQVLVAAAVGGSRLLTKAEASQAIQYLQRCEPTPKTTSTHSSGTVVTEDGMYRMGETIFKVQRAVHGSGHLYAKRLVLEKDPETDQQRGHFVYDAGTIRMLRPEHKLSLEQAREFGRLYGVCCVCGATLTNEESIEAGIGPICAGKGMWS
jgi:hypothetical protein